MSIDDYKRRVPHCLYYKLGDGIEVDIGVGNMVGQREELCYHSDKKVHEYCEYETCPFEKEAI